MRIRFTPLVLAAVFFVSSRSNAQQAVLATTDHKQSKFVGVWRGQFDNLPGIDMVITDEGGQLQGAILFYFHQRQNPTSPYTPTPGLPEPIFNISHVAETLRFQVSHRRAHPPRTLQDRPVKFHFKLRGPDLAELMNESEGAPVLEMKRTDY